MRLVGGVVEDVDSVLMRRSNVCVFGLVWFGFGGDICILRKMECRTGLVAKQGCASY
jgi:hypothetical protein